jgi:hypothetical protein
MIAFLAREAARHTHDATRADAAAISHLAMTIWAYEELVHGVNWFRHSEAGDQTAEGTLAVDTAGRLRDTVTNPRVEMLQVPVRVRTPMSGTFRTPRFAIA